MSKLLLLWQVGLIANVKLHFFLLVPLLSYNNTDAGLKKKKKKNYQNQTKIDWMVPVFVLD